MLLFVAVYGDRSKLSEVACTNIHPTFCVGKNDDTRVLVQLASTHRVNGDVWCSRTEREAAGVEAKHTHLLEDKAVQKLQESDQQKTMSKAANRVGDGLFIDILCEQRKNGPKNIN